MSMLKIVSFLLFLFVIPLITQAEAEQLVIKKYPPYPEVWGYDLSEYPAVKWDNNYLSAYRMPDGDIWFITRIFYNTKKSLHEGREEHTEQKYLLLKFFSGETKELDEHKRNELYDAMDYSLQSETIHFKDGRKIIRTNMMHNFGRSMT